MLTSHEVTEQDESSLAMLQRAYQPTSLRFRPEDSPFKTLFADITHRCNMGCNNCYIPVRTLPDLPADWLLKIISRLPRRTRIRLVGAEPTMREDLPALIRGVRQLGHIPVVLTNGLKLGRRSYVETLKAAGLRTIYFSANGGLRNDLYLALDGLACAERKLKGIENSLAVGMNVTVGMILVRGVNVFHLSEFLCRLIQWGVRDIHLRSVGPTGRYMEGQAFMLDELEALLRGAIGASTLHAGTQDGSSRDFRMGKVAFQLTEWPDLGSRQRGRIAPDGYVEPMFESMLKNALVY